MVSVVLGLVAIVAVVFAVRGYDAARSHSVTPEAATATRMGTNSADTAFAFQPNGSATGTSCSLSSDIHWWSADGTRMLSGARACLRAARSRRIVTIGVVSVNPVGVPLADDIVTYVRC